MGLIFRIWNDVRKQKSWSLITALHLMLAGQTCFASPDWLHKPPLANSEYFFAVGYGEGTTLSEARERATAQAAEEFTKQLFGFTVIVTQTSKADAGSQSVQSEMAASSGTAILKGVETVEVYDKKFAKDRTGVWVLQRIPKAVVNEAIKQHDKMVSKTKVGEKVNLTSDPAGATVEVNGRAVGQTPVIVTLKPNAYLLRFRHHRAHDTVVSLTVRPNQENKYHASMTLVLQEYAGLRNFQPQMWTAKDMSKLSRFKTMSFSAMLQINDDLELMAAILYLKHSGRYEEALVLARKSESLQKANWGKAPFAEFAMAHVLLSMGRYKESRQRFESAARNLPDPASAQMGACNAATGEKLQLDQLVQICQEALKTNDDAPAGIHGLVGYWHFYQMKVAVKARDSKNTAFHARMADAQLRIAAAKDPKEFKALSLEVCQLLQTC